MTLQFANGIRNPMVAATVDKTVLDHTGSNTPWLFIRTGSPPAGTGSTPTGTILAKFALPSTAFGAAASGVITKANTWQTLSADATGTAGWFHIGAPDGGDSAIMGTLGTSGADMIVDSASFVAGQAFSVLSFTLTEGNL